MLWIPIGLGIVFLGLFLYYYFRKKSPSIELNQKDYLNAGNKILYDDKPVIVWFVYSYVPNVRAGTEVSAHAINTWLIERGWKVVVCCVKWCCHEYEGVTIVPIKRNFEDKSKYLKDLYERAAVFCVQNYSSPNIVRLGGKYGKSVVQFIHVENDNNEIVNLKQETPIRVVYNSQTVKEQNPTIHPSIIVKPYVDIEHFRIGEERDAKYVTLINCNANKGGHILQDLARRMPDVEFLGIEGSYARQVLGRNPKNLTYWDSQEDMRKVYKVTKILIMPSQKETWGRTAVEAMAGGIPVVVSRADGLVECVKDGGQICLRDDVQCWETTIRGLLENQEEYLRWSKAALARADQLNSGSDMEKLELFFRDA